MDNGVNTLEVGRTEIPDIPEMLGRKARLWQLGCAGQAVPEETGINADEFRVLERVKEMSTQCRANVSHVSGNKNSHITSIHFDCLAGTCRRRVICTPNARAKPVSCWVTLAQAAKKLPIIVLLSWRNPILRLAHKP
jgi:hypothetical protein